MTKLKKVVAAMAVVAVTFGGTNAMATTRYVTLDNAKKAENTSNCTSKDGYYRIVARHNTYSKSSKLIVGLNEWDNAYKKYTHRSVKELEKSGYMDQKKGCKSGYFARIRLTAGSSKASGTGSVSNEF